MTLVQQNFVIKLQIKINLEGKLEFCNRMESIWEN